MLARPRAALVTAVLVLALVPACATPESPRAVEPTAAPQSSPSSGMPRDPGQQSGTTEADGDEGQDPVEQPDDGTDGGIGPGPGSGTGEDPGASEEPGNDPGGDGTGDDPGGNDSPDEDGTSPGGNGTPEGNGTGPSDNTSGGTGPGTGGNGPGTGDNGTSPGGTGTPDGNSTSPGGNGADPGGTGPGTTDDGFAWVPFGPADPSDPPPEQLYGYLERRDCDGLATSSDTPPWPALAAVCRAVVEGDTSQWSVAEAAVADGPGGGGGCLLDQAWALLTRALEWHERNPGRTPEIGYPTAGGATACPFRITEVQVVDEEGNALGTPLEGPVTGGTLLLIDGEGIDDLESVRIGWGQAVVAEGVFRAEPPDDPRGGGLDDVVVRTPPAPRPGPVEISLRNRAGEVVAPVQFTYVTTQTETPDTGSGTGTDPGTPAAPSGEGG